MNATLKIKNGKELGYDLWQTADCENWSADKWEASINTMISGLKDIYNYPEDRIDDIDLYTLGDVINLLSAISVERS